MARQEPEYTLLPSLLLVIIVGSFYLGAWMQDRGRAHWIDSFGYKDCWCTNDER